MTPFFSSPIPVIAFHRVLPYKNSISVTIDEFDHYLQWFRKRGFRSLTSAQFERALAGEEVVERGLVITFDDGYRDNCYIAAPLLEKYGMNAILFVVTGKIKDEQTGQPTDTWLEEGDERYLSWDEIKSMVDSGIFELHSHTHSHDSSWINSSSANIRQVVQQDIAISVQTLRDQGYTHEIHLAWPWGYFRQEWLDDLSALGIRFSYTTQPGTNYPGCDIRKIMRLSGEKPFDYIKRLCSVGSSPALGRALNSASRTWSAMRGRP
ncbi:polysaccharide deacetylase family protein [Nitrosovibrio tenuis]|uniref:Polysaccharide deacetylase n=1 Tax=Nitrosovibrio tenuis TaxID=1233 RepID=A0A1H7R6Z1_9PROT|nr:polysaccharide deacetylase family protein [Nitrosovibrio tenuis]SEL55963.1 Polysaccharide deacetylase [Nitrosovibrio tenuis]